MTSDKGEPVGAVYGFERMLNRMLGTERPTHVAAAFDSGIPADRLEAVPEYKAQRPDMPGDLRPQFGGVRNVLDAYGIPVIECDGEEADDCIATLATRASAEGVDTAIVSGDLDLLQLVDDRTTVMVPKRGITDLVRYDPAAVRERFGIDPAQLPDFRGLKGDPSDNLPGVPGIGEKTASKLIAEFGTLDALLTRTAEVKPRRIGELLEKYADQARRCRFVSTAKRDLTITVDWDALAYRTPTDERLAQLYQSFGFRTLLQRSGYAASVIAADPLPVVDAEPKPELPTEYRGVEHASDASDALAAIRSAAVVAVALHPPVTSWRGPEPSAIALTTEPGKGIVLPALLALTDPAVRTGFAAIIESETPQKRVHDAKAFHGWAASAGLKPLGVVSDTLLSAGLLDPTVGEPSLAEAAAAAGVPVPRAEPTMPTAVHLFDGAPALDPLIASASDAIFRAAEELDSRIVSVGETSLLHDVELPLARALSEMESIGLRLDRDELDRIRAELDTMIEAASAEIYRLAGETFNVNSPKAIGLVLFEKLGIPGGTKTKTGYATGSEILGPLAAEHPIAAKVLEYREVAKLKSTYVDALPQLIDARTGKLHTTFHQLGAATGRLSSTNPNLQNIPVRTAAGRAVRRAFLPPTPGNVFLAADYSQIELRLFAHLSGDTNLIDAFARGDDVHAFTARAVFGVPEPQPLDPELRRRAKAVNFGILYGMGSFGLAQSAGMTRAQAREFIAEYFARFPDIKRYIDGALEKARSDGYVATLMGRRRYLPDLRSRNHAMRAAAERMAMNAPLQGSAADLIKSAMVALASRIERERIDARMVLQVHDELIFDVPPAGVDALRTIVRDEMERAMALRVKLVVDCKTGPTWADVQ